MLSFKVEKQLTDLAENLINKSKSSAISVLLFCVPYSKSMGDTQGGGRTGGYAKGGGVELDVLWWRFKLFTKRVGTYLDDGLKTEPCHKHKPGHQDPLIALIGPFKPTSLTGFILIGIALLSLHHINRAFHYMKLHLLLHRRVSWSTNWTEASSSQYRDAFIISNIPSSLHHFVLTILNREAAKKMRT